MGNRSGRSVREPDNPGVSLGGRWILDWRSLVGITSIIAGLFAGSRLLVTQDDLLRVEAELEAHATERDSRIWAELARRESIAYRMKDWQASRDWIIAEHERLRSEMKEVKK